MKITIESTDELVAVFPASASAPPISARVWNGYTESGIPVQVLVAMIAVKSELNQAEFLEDLIERRDPIVPGFPARARNP